MGLSNYVSTYQHDFSTASKGFRGRRSLSASNLMNAGTGAVAAPAMMYSGRPTTSKVSQNEILQSVLK